MYHKYSPLLENRTFIVHSIEVFNKWKYSCTAPKYGNNTEVISKYLTYLIYKNILCSNNESTDGSLSVRVGINDVVAIQNAIQNCNN